jgi:hypothetical protein
VPLGRQLTRREDAAVELEELSVSGDDGWVGGHADLRARSGWNSR